MGATNYTRQMAANALLKLVHRLAGGEGEFEDTAIGRTPEEYLIELEQIGERIEMSVSPRAEFPMDEIKAAIAARTAKWEQELSS